jgi:hypothetical protein
MKGGTRGTDLGFLPPVTKSEEKDELFSSEKKSFK